MSNQLVDSAELSALRSNKIRAFNFLKRKKRQFLEKIHLHNVDFLIEKNFAVSFPEENTSPIRLPKTGNFWRSANLFDQREILHRTIIAHALKNSIINPSKNIIDAGAQNGDCALVWAKMITGSVFAIDPSSRNLAFIRKVADLNSIENLETLNFAIGNSEGYLYPLYDLDHTPFSTTPNTAFSEKNKVPATTLDLLFERGKLRSIGFIHLDVEGMELDSLRAARKIIEACAPVITFEAHITVDDIESIFALFRAASYSVFMINEATPGGRPDCINFLALPNSTQLEHQVSTLNAVKPKQAFFKTTVGENLVPIA
jgi:FkbM family methyltransferase